MNLVSKKLLFSLRSLHLGMIMLLATTTSPSIFLASFSVSAEEATGIGNSNNSNNVCVDIGRGEFTCTNDPLAVRQYVDSQQLQNQYQQYLGDDASSASIYLSRGVAQRVDGSESEKKAIQEVLKLMDDYFNKEILALPEYASVRNRWYVCTRVVRERSRRTFRFQSHLPSTLLICLNLLFSVPFFSWLLERYIVSTQTR